MKQITYAPAQQCLAVGRLPGRRRLLTKECGFSLIELLVVVAITGILATISASFYGGYVTSANRTEARAALTETAGSLEKCKILYGAYNNANCNVTLPFDTESNYYTISGAPNATTFVLTATPVAAGRQAVDTDCKTFTLSQTGATGATGTDVPACW